MLLARVVDVAVLRVRAWASPARLRLKFPDECPIIAPPGASHAARRTVGPGRMRPAVRPDDRAGWHARVPVTEQAPGLHTRPLLRAAPPYHLRSPMLVAGLAARLLAPSISLRSPALAHFTEHRDRMRPHAPRLVARAAEPEWVSQRATRPSTMASLACRGGRVSRCMPADCLCWRLCALHGHPRISDCARVILLPHGTRALRCVCVMQDLWTHVALAGMHISRLEMDAHHIG